MMSSRPFLQAFTCVLVTSVLPAIAIAAPVVENVLDLSGIALFVGGITYDPTTDHLFVADTDADAVHEVQRTDGALVQTWPTPGGATKPIGITYRALSDHLFFVSETDNALYEVTTDGALIAMNAFSIPPTSVSGCTIHSLADRLFVVDDFDDNLIETLLDGTVMAVRSLLVFGIFDADAITYNSIDNTMFIGDDIAKRLFEVSADASILFNIYDLGPAGLNTGGVEGLAFDHAGERLFLSQGASRQVYEISGVTTGGGVPVEPTTWGRIKSQFAE